MTEDSTDKQDIIDATLYGRSLDETTFFVAEDAFPEERGQTIDPEMIKLLDSLP